MRTASRAPASEGGPDRWARAALVVALGAAIAGGAHHFWPAPREARAAVAAPPERTATPSRATAPARAPGPVIAAATTAAPAEAPLPGSLRGTEEDGALREDDHGDLVVGPEVLRLFDYYLSATGEESPDAIRARIVAAIHRRLGDRPAATQAISLLDHYLAYRKDTRRLEVAGDDLGKRLDALHRLRADHFGPLAGRLFGDEERAVGVALDQHRVLTDSAISPEDRERRLAELEARLPDAVREARAAAARPLREAAEEEAMRAAGANDDDVRAYRVATAGEEAADRLATLDQQRAAWRARLDAFRKARAAIEASEPDPDCRRIAVLGLLESSFTPMERVRVEAADRMETEGR